MANSSTNVLLTFTGFHDPYFEGLVQKEEQAGPILALLSVRSFDEIYLFETPNTQKVTQVTKEAILGLYPKSQVEILAVALDDPTDYKTILKGLRNHIQPLLERHEGAKFHIAVTSGTPQMHASWLLLAAAGEIPAHILYTRPPHFVTKDKPLVSEIDLAAREFPTVKFLPQQNATSGSELDVEAVIAQLNIVGDHPSIRRALEIAATSAPSQAPFLILGETGTGKELIARLIHRLSGRSNQEFVAVNCAAIPENLVESILFGHKKGAFTGAISNQIGKFDSADDGTLFLDEIGDLPLSVQAKLLRVLQDGMVEPLGRTTAHKVDVRIIAATNCNLRKLIKDSKFREDLFYRLCVVEIKLPPLRERRSDIPKLALNMLDKLNRSIRRNKRFSPDALVRLQSHNWPGNVRDLENVIERSMLLCPRDVLRADDLIITDPITSTDPLTALPEPHEGFSLDGFLTSARRQLILKALETTNGNQSKASRLLGITPQAVHKFLQQEKL